MHKEKAVRVGLFVPCYVDAFHPDVGIATLELLERFGIEVDYPFNQTCCGQPMTNSGCHAESAATEALFVKNFQDYDYVVAPSGSCVHHVRYNLDAIVQTEAVRKVRRSTFDLVEFLHDIVEVEALQQLESRDTDVGMEGVDVAGDEKPDLHGSLLENDGMRPVNDPFRCLDRRPPMPPVALLPLRFSILRSRWTDLASEDAVADDRDLQRSS